MAASPEAFSHGLQLLLEGQHDEPLAEATGQVLGEVVARLLAWLRAKTKSEDTTSRTVRSG